MMRRKIRKLPIQRVVFYVKQLITVICVKHFWTCDLISYSENVKSPSFNAGGK